VRVKNTFLYKYSERVKKTFQQHPFSKDNIADKKIVVNSPKLYMLYNYTCNYIELTKREGEGLQYCREGCQVIINCMKQEHEDESYLQITTWNTHGSEIKNIFTKIITTQVKQR